MTVAAEPSWTETSVSGSERGRRGRLRALLAAIAAALGVLFGALALPGAAQAADFNAWISGGNDPYIDIGGSPATITVEVQATFERGTGPKDATVSASLSGLDGLATVDVQEGHCTRTGAGVATCQGMTADETRQIQFIVAPMAESDLPEGQTQTGELKIAFDGGDQKTGVTVAGHAQNSAGNVSGTVTSNADPVSGAKVVLNDGDGTNHETSTNDNGEFNFDSASLGVAPGSMKLTITKDGFEDYETEFEVASNSGFQQNITMNAEEAEEEETTEAAEESPPPATDTPVAEEEDTGGMSGTLIVLIIIGALLVVGGIIGIVFLLRGGKNDGDDDDEDESFAPDGPPEHTPTAAQVGTPGVYAAGPAPGQDAPTMIHQGPLVDGGAPTAFGPAYGNGDDSTQVMPQAAPPGTPPPPAPGADDTQILSTVKGLGPGPGAPPPIFGSDATQVMPQANPPSRPPQSAFADPASTQPHPAPSPSPSPAPPPPSPYPSPSPSPTPPPTTGRPASMFEPQNPDIAPGSQPPMSRDPYAPPPSPSPGPTPQPYEQPQPSQPPQSYEPPRGYEPSQPPSQPPQPYRPTQSYQPPPPSAPPAAPSAPPSDAYQGGEPYPSGATPGPMSRDPYAPPPEPGPPGDSYTPPPTRAMPQGGFPESPYGSHASPSPQQQPPSPYAPEQPGSPYAPDQSDEGEANSRRRDETDRRGWGEWDDRPRSW